jgi:hypothetical protein
MVAQPVAYRVALSSMGIVSLVYIYDSQEILKRYESTRHVKPVNIICYLCGVHPVALFTYTI